MSRRNSKPYEIVERALELSTTDGCVVIANENSSANLRWAGNALTTNGVTRGRTLTVIATVDGAEGSASGVVTRSAVTTDDLILAGFAMQSAAQGQNSFKILGDPFTDEKYGVGLKKGDTKTCEAVNTAIAKMYSDGTAKTLLDKWFGKAQGLTLPTTAPTPEGCS